MTGILFGCFLLVCVGYKVLGHEIFADPYDGNGSTRSPTMTYEEEEEEEDYEKEFQEFINQKKKHFNKALVENNKSNSKK